MRENDVAQALPLWINGHAFLTVTPVFQDVLDPLSRKVLRRIPLCGFDEVQMATSAAQAAFASWASLSARARAALLAAVGGALEDYSAHFAALITEESGKESTLALAEVDESVALLNSSIAGADAGVVAIIGNAAMPLLSVLHRAVPALLAGATLVVRPNPETPSALFALAELTARCGLPSGVFNIVHGGDEVADCLRAVQAGRALDD